MEASSVVVLWAEAPPSSTYDRVPQVSAYARRERRTGQEARRRGGRIEKRGRGRERESERVRQPDEEDVEEEVEENR